MDVYLIRHTRVQAAGICYGQADVPLAATFSEEAAHVRDKLPPAVLAGCRLFTSPAARCQALAATLGPAPTPDERLRELHFGTWELQAWSELPLAETEPWMTDFVGQAPPEGESFEMLQHRAAAFLQELAQPSLAEPAVVVTHAGVVRALLCYCLEIPLQNAFQLAVDYGSVTQLSLQYGKWSLVAFNR